MLFAAVERAGARIYSYLFSAARCARTYSYSNHFRFSHSLRRGPCSYFFWARVACPPPRRFSQANGWVPAVDLLLQSTTVRSISRIGCSGTPIVVYLVPLILAIPTTVDLLYLT